MLRPGAARRQVRRKDVVLNDQQVAPSRHGSEGLAEIPERDLQTLPTDTILE